MTAAPSNQRTVWVDVFRGIAILLVVFGHTARGLDHAGIWNGYEGGVVDRWIYAFHMPAFFFAAGLFARSSLAKGAGRYVITKCRTVLYPYILWSIIHLAVMSLVGRQANSTYDSTMWTRLHYQPVGNYWFLYVLFIWQLLFLITRGGIPGRWIFMALAIGAWATAPSKPFDYLGATGSLWVWNDVLKYGIYFYLGCWSSRNGIATSAPAKTLCAFALLGFSALTVLTAAGKSYQQAWWDLPLAVSGIVGLQYLAMAIDKNELSSWFIVLGRNSLEIYLAHNLFSAAARIALVRIGVHDVTTHAIVGMFVGVTGPLMLLWLSQKMRFRWLFRL